MPQAPNRDPKRAGRRVRGRPGAWRRAGDARNGGDLPDSRPGHGPPPGSPGRRPGRRLAGRVPPSARRWLAFFAAALTLLLVRFLAPTPVGQADNRDGPRLMCGLGMEPVTGHHPRFFRFAYFEYRLSPAACAGTSAVPFLGSCCRWRARQAADTAVRPARQPEHDRRRRAVLRAGRGRRSPAWRPACGSGCGPSCWWRRRAGWPSRTQPSSTSSAARSASPPPWCGLMLVAAGVLYLGRGWRSTVVRAGCWPAPGASSAILSKEQYLVLAGAGLPHPGAGHREPRARAGAAAVPRPGRQRPGCWSPRPAGRAGRRVHGPGTTPVPTASGCTTSRPWT